MYTLPKPGGIRRIWVSPTVILCPQHWQHAKPVNALLSHSQKQYRWHTSVIPSIPLARWQAPRTETHPSILVICQEDNWHMHINMLNNDYMVLMVSHISSVAFLLKCCCLRGVLLVRESVRLIIPEQTYSQASRLLFAFSVSGWRVQRKCEVTKKPKTKEEREREKGERRTISMFWGKVPSVIKHQT